MNRKEFIKGLMTGSINVGPSRIPEGIYRAQFTDNTEVATQTIPYKDDSGADKTFDAHSVEMSLESDEINLKDNVGLDSIGANYFKQDDYRKHTYEVNAEKRWNKAKTREYVVATITGFVSQPEQPELEPTKPAEPVVIDDKKEGKKATT